MINADKAKVQYREDKLKVRVVYRVIVRNVMLKQQNQKGFLLIMVDVSDVSSVRKVVHDGKIKAQFRQYRFKLRPMYSVIERNVMLRQQETRVPCP